MAKDASPSRRQRVLFEAFLNLHMIIFQTSSDLHITTLLDMSTGSASMPHLNINSDEESNGMYCISTELRKVLSSVELTSMWVHAIIRV